MKPYSPVCLCAALAFAACAPKPPAEQPEPGVKVLDRGGVMPIDHPPVGSTGGGSATGGGGGGSADGGTGGGTSDGGVRPPSAWSQRLTVRQLAGSMPVALGGNTWLIGTGNGFNVRGATLGEADYISVVDENLEPTALYLKFMSDAARDGCTRAATTDAALPANQRVLMRFADLTDSVATNPTGVDQNLRYLKLRFHGVKIADTDTTSIARLRTLFDASVKGVTDGGTATQASVREGWRAVCVALLMAPEYHLY